MWTQSKEDSIRLEHNVFIKCPRDHTDINKLLNKYIKWKETNILCREFQIIYIDFPPSSRWNITRHSLSVGIVTLFQGVQYEGVRVGHKNFTVGETWQTCF